MIQNKKSEIGDIPTRTSLAPGALKQQNKISTLSTACGR
jgi:hypothetical protein